jgi:integrase
MNFVEPIRDRKKIAQIKNLLRGQRRFRDLLLFTVGINTALRISDLLELRIGHFLDNQRRYKRRFWIHEQKRNKRHEVVINQSIREALEEYLAAYPGIADNFENFSFFNTKMNFQAYQARTGLEVHRFYLPRYRDERQLWHSQLEKNLGLSRKNAGRGFGADHAQTQSRVHCLHEAIPGHH